MDKLIVSSFFKEKLKFLPVDFTVDKAEFELMPLTDDLIELAKEKETSEEVIYFAADNGLSVDNMRITDNAKLAKSIKEFWALEEMPEASPSVKHQVGEKVLEISGLDDFLLDMLSDERLAEEESIIDGDNLPDGDVTLEQLHNDASRAVR